MLHRAKNRSLSLCSVTSADGTTTPPCIVFPERILSTDIRNQLPDYWAIGRSVSGWTVAATFEEYMRNVFQPWLAEKVIQLPVIVFTDRHKSHIDFSLHQFCTENKIFLYCLHPNATHLIQLCAVSIFKAVTRQFNGDQMFACMYVHKHKNE